MSHWMEHGAPQGIALPVPPGGLFPAAVNDAEKTEEEVKAQYRDRGNHPSFYDTFGETEPPSLDLIRKYSKKGRTHTITWKRLLLHMDLFTQRRLETCGNAKRMGTAGSLALSRTSKRIW